MPRTSLAPRVGHHGPRTGPVALSQLPLQHLAAGIDRQGVDDDDAAGDFVVGHGAAGPTQDGATQLGRVPAVTGRGRGYHVGAAHLAQALVGDPHYRHLAYRLVAPQDGLDLGRVGVEATHHEHVLQPVRDGDVARPVHHTDVAGVQPAVAVD